MRTFLVFIVAIALSVSTADAQVKTIHFKKLQECLPSKVYKGFEREKPGGRTQTAMGMSTSEATVEYLQPMKEDLKEGEEAPPQVGISIKIQDMVGMPYALMQFGMMQEYENETEDGYEKSVNVLDKYRGMETAQTGESKSIKTTFGVANRFLVEVEISHSNDAALMKEVLQSIDLTKLEKLPDAK